MVFQWSMAFMVTKNDCHESPELQLGIAMGAPVEEPWQSIVHDIVVEVFEEWDLFW